MSGLHYDVHEGKGPHALIVHGVLSARSQWTPNLAALRSVCSPVIVELLGHGRSAAPPDPQAYAPEAYVGAFETIREAVGAERWFVIGHSLGAALSIRYVLEHQDRVISHVFMNSNSAFADERWRAGVRRGVEASAKAIEEGGREAIEKHPLHPGRSRRLSPEVRDALVADARLHDPAGVANTFRHTVPDSPVRERIGEVAVPGLFLVGTREEQFEPSRRYAESAMGGLEQVVELDTGHAVNLHDPEGFDRAVTEFFGRRN